MPGDQQVGDEHRGEHHSRTRYLKPVEPISFTNHEMLQGIFAAISPGLVSSVNQLHGERKGVVRVTCKNKEGIQELENKLQARRIQINTVRLAPVAECGHFVRVTLVDVPSYLSSQDIERDLKDYGPVVHVKREYLDYNNYKIENETRFALFSHLVRDIPQRVVIDNHDVFATYRMPSSKRPGMPQHEDPLLVQPNNIPKHVMNSISTMSFSEGIRERLKHHIDDNTKTGSLPFPKASLGGHSNDLPIKKTSVGTNTSLDHKQKQRGHHKSSVEIQTDDPGGEKTRPLQLCYNSGTTHVLHRRRASFDYEGPRERDYEVHYPPPERSKTPNGETHF